MDSFFDINPYYLMLAGRRVQSFTVLLSIGIIVYLIIRGRKNQLFYSYLWFLFFVFAWSAHDSLRPILLRLLGALGFHGPKLIIGLRMGLTYLARCFIGASWLVFCLRFVRSRIGEEKKYVFLLYLPPIFFYLSAVTNQYHKLFLHFYSPGPLFWPHLILANLYTLFGVFILVKNSLGKSTAIKVQSVLLSLAILIPLIFNAIQDYNNLFNYGRSVFGTDIMPFGFFVTVTIFTFIAVKYRLTNIIPMAYRKIIVNMKEAIVVVDNYNRVVEFNPAFNRTFPDIDIKVDALIRSLTDQFTNRLVNREIGLSLLKKLSETVDSPYSGEIGLFVSVVDRADINNQREGSASAKYYAVNFQPLVTRGKIIGKIVSFNDITVYKSLLRELNEKNSELNAINEKLTKYAEVVEELAVSKERNRMAREIHDTLGHTITFLITLLEVSKITLRKNPVETEAKIDETLEIAREGLAELRRSIVGLSPLRLTDNHFQSAIKELVGEFEKNSGLRVELVAEGIIKHIDTLKNKELSDTLYRICQEALTNSLRHGKAKNVTIIFQGRPGLVRLFIFDDGCGCENIQKGYGLLGMEERVKAVGGTLSYGSDGESGFNIHADFPVEEV